MDLQQQQTGWNQTDNPQSDTQPSLAPTAANLQQTNTADVNKLNAVSLSVTAACTTSCSGSIPPPSAVTNSSSSSGTWVVIGVGIVVIAIVAWMFRQLSGGHK